MNVVRHVVNTKTFAEVGLADDPEASQRIAVRALLASFVHTTLNIPQCRFLGVVSTILTSSVSFFAKRREALAAGVHHRLAGIRYLPHAALLQAASSSAAESEMAAPALSDETFWGEVAAQQATDDASAAAWRQTEAMPSGGKSRGGTAASQRCAVCDDDSPGRWLTRCKGVEGSKQKCNVWVHPACAWEVKRGRVWLLLAGWCLCGQRQFLQHSVRIARQRTFWRANAWETFLRRPRSNATPK